jgi:hypothetical protein
MFENIPGVKKLICYYWRELKYHGPFIKFLKEHPMMGPNCRWGIIKTMKKWYDIEQQAYDKKIMIMINPCENYIEYGFIKIKNL